MRLNKKFLQIIAAAWILIFHLWIQVSNTVAEQYILKIGYVGVDLFFFLAAYSLADKEIKYFSFLKNRFFLVYIKYIIFVVVAAMYKSWSVVRSLKVLSGVEFFQKGGGSFLWFIPAIILFYLFYPLFIKWKLNPVLKTLIVLATWFGLSLLSEKVFGYTQIFIFTNRIPVILVGYILKKYNLKRWIGLVCLPVGLAALYFWGFTYKLNLPLREMYFVLAIPVVIGLAAVSSFIPESKAMSFLGSATIEIYALQMIFGAALVSSLFSFTGGNKIITNILMLVIVWSVSLLVSWLYKLIYSKTLGKKKS